MSVQRLPNQNSACCRWLERSHFNPDQQRCVGQITLLIISIVALAMAVFLTLVSTGILWETCPLYSLGEVAIFGSGVLLTLMVVATLINLSILLQDCCNKSFH